jgi:hypothetical protein
VTEGSGLFVFQEERLVYCVNMKHDEQSLGDKLMLAKSRDVFRSSYVTSLGQVTVRVQVKLRHEFRPSHGTCSGQVT